MTSPFRWHRVQRSSGSWRTAQRATTGALALLLWSSLFLLTVKLLWGQSAGAKVLWATALHTLLVCFGALLGLQGLRWGPAARSGVLLYGRWEVLTLFLLWGLLGFGGLTLAGKLLQPSLYPFVSMPTRLGVLGALAFLSAGLALLAQVCDRHLGGAALSLQAYLWVQETWLTLVALLCLFLVDQGYGWVERGTSWGVMAIAFWDAWRLVQCHVPQWITPWAIAPEAITRLVLQVEGVTACRLLQCRGLVGRGVAVELELRLHPELDGLRQRLGRQVEELIQSQYGPAQVEIFVRSGLGDQPVRLALHPLDDWPE